jgi:hypothetical protein
MVTAITGLANAHDYAIRQLRHQKTARSHVGRPDLPVPGRAPARDPEEARKLLDPVLERMMEAVHRYEGTVNQVMGDGIMALFGAPVAPS